MRRTRVTFVGQSEKGAGRGRRLGIPTINIRVADVPKDLQKGIYACRVRWEKSPWRGAVMHWGPRPVFQDSVSCEIHILDGVEAVTPDTIEVMPVGFLREVRNFRSPEKLMQQIASDIAEARAMLAA